MVDYIDRILTLHLKNRVSFSRQAKASSEDFKLRACRKSTTPFRLQFLTDEDEFVRNHERSNTEQEPCIFANA